MHSFDVPPQAVIKSKPLSTDIGHSCRLFSLDIGGAVILQILLRWEIPVTIKSHIQKLMGMARLKVRKECPILHKHLLTNWAHKRSDLSVRDLRWFAEVSSVENFLGRFLQQSTLIGSVWTFLVRL